jgi:hypothetical protein
MCGGNNIGAAAAIDGRERQLDPLIAERGPGVCPPATGLRRSVHFDDIGGHSQTGQKMAWLGMRWRTGVML